MPTIQFKAKPVTRHYVDGTVARRFIPVPQFKKIHCNMHEFRTHPKYGSWANSDLFTGILRRLRGELFPKGELNPDELPDGVTVDQSGFLASVTISIP